MTRRTLAAAAAVTLLALTACSSDDDAGTCEPMTDEQVAQLMDAAIADVELGDGYFYPLPDQLVDDAPMNLHDYAAVAYTVGDDAGVVVFGVGDNQVGPVIGLGDAQEYFEWGAAAQPDTPISDWMDAAESDPAYAAAAACVTG